MNLVGINGKPLETIVRQCVKEALATGAETKARVDERTIEDQVLAHHQIAALLDQLSDDASGEFLYETVMANIRQDVRHLVSEMLGTTNHPAA
jgi:hypothetical protein